MIREASLMLCTRGWPAGKFVVNDEIFSLGSVAFAMAVVNSGSVGFVVATVAVRVVVAIAFQTSVAIDASSSPMPATCGRHGRACGRRRSRRRPWPRPRRPAFSAAACTTAASFFGSARGVMRARVVGARGRWRGANAFGASVNDFPLAVTVTGPETATSANSLRTRASSSAVTFGAQRGGRDLDGAVARPPAAHGVGGALDVGASCR